MRALLAFALASIALLSTTEVEAQTFYEPEARQGYFIGGGVRSGALLSSADGVEGPGFANGGGLAIRMGQMVDDMIGFGLSFTGGGGATDEWNSGYGGLLLGAQLVPMPKENLALHAGIGMGGIGISRKDETQKREDDPEGGPGALYALGMSYDWFPFYEPEDGSGGFAITVFFEGVLLPTSDVLAGGVFMGVELTYWFGLDDNKLTTAVAP